jgi:hypothetical protein
MLQHPTPSTSVTEKALSQRQARGTKKDAVKSSTGKIAKQRRARMPRRSRPVDVSPVPLVHRTLEVWHDENRHAIPIQLLPA